MSSGLRVHDRAVACIHCGDLVYERQVGVLAHPECQRLYNMARREERRAFHRGGEEIQGEMRCGICRYLTTCRAVVFNGPKWNGLKTVILPCEVE